MPTVDFSDDAHVAVTRGVRRTSDEDRFPNSPRLAPLRSAGEARPGVGAKAGRDATAIADRTQCREQAGEGEAVMAEGALLDLACSHRPDNPVDNGSAPSGQFRSSTPIPGNPALRLEVVEQGGYRNSGENSRDRPREDRLRHKRRV